MRIRAFKALMPKPALAERVAAVPYDVVTSSEAAALAAGNPCSFLHITHSEIDLEQCEDTYSEPVYRKAAANFQRFQDEGILVREDVPCLYIYRQQIGGHSQQGIVACCHIEDYENNVIRQHERTRADKEADRSRHMEALNANPGPVFAVYRDVDDIDRMVAEREKDAPLWEFTAADGIRHTVWRVAGGAELVKVFERVTCCYIADGHHRAAAAAAVGARRRAQNGGHTGAEEYNWFLTVLFPASQLRILPYNRVVEDLNGLTVAEFLSKVRARFDVVETGHRMPSVSGIIVMYVGGRWYELSWTRKDGARVIGGSLDTSILQERLLAPVLGIDDPRTSKRIEFIGGVYGAHALAERVDTRRGAVAFSMYPVTVEDLMLVSDAGGIMPPKSTWFEPKLRSGLFVHTL